MSIFQEKLAIYYTWYLVSGCLVGFTPNYHLLHDLLKQFYIVFYPVGYHSNCIVHLMHVCFSCSLFLESRTHAHSSSIVETHYAMWCIVNAEQMSVQQNKKEKQHSWSQKKLTINFFFKSMSNLIFQVFYLGFSFH